MEKNTERVLIKFLLDVEIGMDAKIVFLYLGVGDVVGFLDEAGFKTDGKFGLLFSSMLLFSAKENLLNTKIYYVFPIGYFSERNL